MLAMSKLLIIRTWPFLYPDSYLQPDHIHFWWTQW